MLGLRAAGEEVGWAFQLQDPAVVLLLAFLMLSVTANLAGLFEIGGIGAGEKLTRKDHGDVSNQLVPLFPLLLTILVCQICDWT